MTREESKVYLKSFELCKPYTMDAQGVYKNAVEVAVKTLEQQDKILQILDDCDLEAWEILEKIKDVVRE